MDQFLLRAVLAVGAVGNIACLASIAVAMLFAKGRVNEPVPVASALPRPGRHARLPVIR